VPVDRFENVHAPNLPYARGKILAGTEDDFAKLELAWSFIRGEGRNRSTFLPGSNILCHWQRRRSSSPMTRSARRFISNG
jgi:hypothetical protein